jgi:hypothetical protein
MTSGSIAHQLAPGPPGRARRRRRRDRRPRAQPSACLAGRELLEEVRRRLNDDERRLADGRAEGHDWAVIAAQVGGTAEARRKQLARALDRVAGELGLDG